MSAESEYLVLGVQPPLRVMFEDHALIIVNKFAGQLFQGNTRGKPTSLAEQVKEFIRQKKQTEGDVFLGIVHRLDRPVSGTVAFARNSKFAQRMSEQFSNRTVAKKYLAIVGGKISLATGHWIDELPELNEKDEPIGAAQKCELKYELLATSSIASVVAIELMTGRRHQIRRQFGKRGHAIIGDDRYGGARIYMQPEPEARFAPIALHSFQLSFDHPLTYERQVVRASPPIYWKQLLTDSSFSDSMALYDTWVQKI